MPLFPRLTGDPAMDREESHNFVRTLPMYRVLALAQQGLKMAARQLGDRIVEPVEGGFKRA